jgi:Ca-activated chloride channel family protein
VSVEWVRPEWLLLLPLLPLLAVWPRAGVGIALPFPRGGALAAQGARVRWVVARAPVLMRVLCLALVTLALARPRTVAAVVEAPSPGIPIVVAIDVSSSMLAQDFRPRDRLEVAKRTVAEFVRARPDDPIGVVAFAAEALTLVPVTTLHPVVLEALGSLRVGLLEDGTAIGEGLATATNRLRRLEAEDRVVILMSDGESNRGEVDPREAARAAAAFGIRVFTIGVGSEGVAPVPVRTEDAGVRFAELPVGIDESLLRDIARTTGGRYFRATDAEALRRVYGEIDALVASPVEARRVVRHAEWYLPLLLAAAAVLAAEWLLRGSRWGVVP